MKNGSTFYTKIKLNSLTPEIHSGSRNGSLSLSKTNMAQTRPTHHNWIMQLESEKQESANGRNNEHSLSSSKKNRMASQGSSYKHVLLEGKNYEVRQDIKDVMIAFKDLGCFPPIIAPPLVFPKRIWRCSLIKK